MSIKEWHEQAGLELYPQEYLVEEDEMGDSGAQDWLMRYLVQVLGWLYHEEQWMIAVNRHHYHPAIRNSINLIVPDVAVFKDIPLTLEEQLTLKSWTIDPPKRPAPPVVFEISSGDTWANDIGAAPYQKPATYGRIGMREYFAYDPNQPAVWTKQGGKRLLGWRYEQGQPIPLEPDERGWLWSEVLESWLAEDGFYLRLYDRAGQMRLTEVQASAETRTRLEQRVVEVEAAQRKEATARRKEAIARRKETTALQKEMVARQAAEKGMAEAEAARQTEVFARQAAEQRATEAERLLSQSRQQKDKSE